MVFDSLKLRLRQAIARAARTEQLERRIESLERSVAELSPETIQRSPSLDASIERFCARNALDRLDVTISKNDLMYQYILKEHTTKTAAYLWYLESGLQMYRIVDTIAQAKGARLHELSRVLDFASGYGRLTRFLVRALDPQRVWMAEIKKGAVEFQRHQFGVSGFVSSVIPERAQINERFDIIFVASLFSHLPDSTFARWLQRLCDWLSPRGVIAFTVHDVALHGVSDGVDDTAPRICYEANSEEISLFSEDDSLGVDSYGFSIVNESYVAETINGLCFPNKKYWRFKRAVHNRQDLYVLSRDANDDFSNLALPPYRPQPDDVGVT
jgi:SAM-dependent methyltransferase